MSAETSHVTDISGGANAAPATPKKPQQAKRVEVSTANLEAKRMASTSSSAATWPMPSMDVTKFFEESRERMKDAFQQANGKFDNMRAAAREAGDVCQECQVAALGGLKDINEQVFELIQSEVDRGYDFLRSATEAKGVSDLVQLQADYLREAMEARIDSSKAIGELTAKFFKSAYAPLQSGFTSIVDKMRKS